ncbi:MAG: cob(I)yrinic acid a,c-diamide adenosyltransferase [Chlorobi bacterium]|nr:cob(I)yrinic acid a,c-diamide adenosyltransferase [Chlorobiota bacterium]
MKIYTKTGDTGETSLFGGKRVPKDNLRIEAYGTIDELNSLLGVSLTEIKNSEIISVVTRIQNELFNVGADLAAPIKNDEKKSFLKRTGKDDILRLENDIDKFNSALPELKKFILPGGSKGASLLQFARSVCRRAERIVVTLSDGENIGEFPVVYLNRLSDLLFILGRAENQFNRVPEPEWNSR